MNILLLAVLASCPPGSDPVYWQGPAPAAAYPDAGPAPGNPSHQGRPRLFGWLRGHRHGQHPAAGNGPADGNWAPAVTDPAPLLAAPPVAAGTAVEVAAPQPAPPVVAMPAPAEPAPRLVPRPQVVPTSAEPPLAAPLDDAPRPMPRGAPAPTGAQPPRN